MSTRPSKHVALLVQPMTEAARTLATEEGLNRFQMILSAIDVWRDHLTPTQRLRLRAGGGACAKVTADRLEILGLATSPAPRTIELTDWGRYVVGVNNRATPSSSVPDRSE
jgi:hypothetical protein